MSTRRQQFGWQGLHMKRMRDAVAPRGKHADPKPDPVTKDTEAELDRLAKERAGRARDLSELLAFEDE